MVDQSDAVRKERLLLEKIAALILLEVPIETVCRGGYMFRWCGDRLYRGKRVGGTATFELSCDAEGWSCVNLRTGIPVPALCSYGETAANPCHVSTWGGGQGFEPCDLGDARMLYAVSNQPVTGIDWNVTMLRMDDGTFQWKGDISTRMLRRTADGVWITSICTNNEPLGTDVGDSLIEYACPDPSLLCPWLNRVLETNIRSNAFLKDNLPGIRAVCASSYVSYALVPRFVLLKGLSPTDGDGALFHVVFEDDGAGGYNYSYVTVDWNNDLGNKRYKLEVHDPDAGQWVVWLRSMSKPPAPVAFSDTGMLSPLCCAWFADPERRERLSGMVTV